MLGVPVPPCRSNPTLPIWLGAALESCHCVSIAPKNPACSPIVLNPNPYTLNPAPTCSFLRSACAACRCCASSASAACACCDCALRSCGRQERRLLLSSFRNLMQGIRRAGALWSQREPIGGLILPRKEVAACLPKLGLLAAGLLALAACTNTHTCRRACSAAAASTCRAASALDASASRPALLAADYCRRGVAGCAAHLLLLLQAEVPRQAASLQT
jgi:hypothetical protein